MQIAPVQQLVLIPRNENFAQELHEAEFVLIPQAMARIADAALRDPIMISTSALAGHVTRIKQALETGEADSVATESALLNFWLLREAVIHWRDAPAGVRFPAGEPDAAV